MIENETETDIRYQISNEWFKDKIYKLTFYLTS